MDRTGAARLYRRGQRYVLIGGVPVSTDRLLSPEEIAELSGLSRKVIYRAIEDGELRAYKLRGRLRVRPEWLEAWLAANEVKPTLPPEPQLAGAGAMNDRPVRGSLRALQRRLEAEGSA